MKRSKNKKNEMLQCDRYVQNLLSPDEKKVFETLLAADTDLRCQVLISKMLYKFYELEQPALEVHPSLQSPEAIVEQPLNTKRWKLLKRSGCNPVLHFAANALKLKW